MIMDILFITIFVVTIMSALIIPNIVSKKNKPKVMSVITFIQVFSLCCLHDNHFTNMSIAKFWFIGLSIGIMILSISHFKDRVLTTIGFIIGFISLAGYSLTI